MSFLHFYSKKTGVQILLCMIYTVAGLLYVTNSRAEQYQHAIVSAIAGDGSNGSLSWIQERKSGGARLYEHNLITGIADIRVAISSIIF
jgi:hypothetical protein